MKTLKVYRHYFTDSDCYKSQIFQTPTGVQVHSTGANNPYLKRYVGPDDGILGENKYKNYHNRSGVSVCANAYIGKLNNGTVAIYQALPWDQRCWLSGSNNKGNANKMGYVGFEICEDNLNNEQYFYEAVMDKSVTLTAWLCQEYNIPISNVHDHCELYDMGIASNHGDIKHWLKKYGLTMNDYREAVQKVLNEGVKIIYIIDGKEEITTPIIIGKAIVTASSGSTVNFRKTPEINDDNLITAIPIGTEVQLVEIGKIWDKIYYKNQIGYMMKEFLKIENVNGNIQISQNDFNSLKTQLIQMKEQINSLLNLLDIIKGV